MRAVGLITEYNPFHNGHLYHLRESLRESGAQVAVAVMSGHFLQRGEPALVDKWVRTRMALAAGVDVVVELPFPWACNSAPHFAAGAVCALDALGGVTHLCFGSEAGELAPLQRCADLLLDRGAQLGEQTAALLREGLPFPAARAQAVADEEPELAAALASPNNILGIAYLRALSAAGSALSPLTVERIGAGYHQEHAVRGIASATGIRRMLEEGKDVSLYLPPAVWQELGPPLRQGRCLEWSRLSPLLLARLLRGPDSLRHLYLVEDGIENRLCAAAEYASTYGELVDGVKSRHFTRTRIQRLLSYVLNEAAREEMEAFLAAGPLYLHLLGVSARGRAFLASCRKRLRLPLVQNYSRVHTILRRFYGSGSEKHRLAEAMLALELRATANYTLLMGQWGGGSRKRDYYEDEIFCGGERTGPTGESR